ncbi:hypothetical protein CWE12_13300 [Aliidiomarina sedimenti]|uniref:DUF3530 domain-containing protein n=1 Tax=Aliidiomarina sedimenti TaxID=1933879 RepID=A0ABY0BUZ5_9GAMM|nr:DUF3530 family protein [Aliidiomarina sedimenti]RUO27905.1 hypothetical protein CWE12_13300 [Aliidiomarina sedimenti]
MKTNFQYPRWSLVGGKPFGIALVGAALLASSASFASQNDFEYYLPPGEVVWLEDDDDRYLLLEKENEQAYDRGRMILLPDVGTHPLQSSAIRALYQSMIGYGWYTFALQPPTTDIGSFTWQAEDAYERYPEPATVEPLKDALRLRMNAALTHTAEHTGALVVVAEGVSAALLADLMAEGEFAQIDALIVHGVYYPQWQLNQALATTLAELRIPLLDLAPGDGNSWATDTNSRRQQQARRHNHLSYRQRILPAGRHAEQPRYLQHHVYGWLQSEDF